MKNMGTKRPLKAPVEKFWEMGKGERRRQNRRQSNLMGIRVWGKKPEFLWRIF